jgi:hypothetical protein
MEALVFFLFIGVLLVGHLAISRWWVNSSVAPWIMLSAATALVIIAWVWGSPETRGASVVLTGAAIVPAIRAVKMLRDQRRSQA